MATKLQLNRLHSFTISAQSVSRWAMQEWVSTSCRVHTTKDNYIEFVGGNRGARALLRTSVKPVVPRFSIANIFMKAYRKA